MNYLIIEDDPKIRDIIKDILDILEPDASVIVLKDGNEASTWLDKVEINEAPVIPNIAFIDIRMPGPQGHELAERMRKMGRLQNIGIVLMTAYELDEKEYNEVMQRSQADRYIPKPLPGVKGLNQVIEEIMAMRQSIEE